MALDYVKLTDEILQKVGGKDNIAGAAYCMTRLRLTLKDEGKADDEAVKAIKGVKGLMKQGGQYQIIIGNEVSNLFKEFKTRGNWGEDGGAPAKAEGNPIQRLFGFISGSMTPMLPAMLGSGMLKVILTLLTNFAGMSTESSTYIILYAVSDAFFYFLPIFLAVNVAKKIGGNPMLFAVIAAAMCYPNLINLLGGATEGIEMGTFLGTSCTYLFGIPVISASYTSSVLPILLMAPVMKWAEDFGDKVSPNVLKAFLKPLIFLIICTPVALCVLGPLGTVLGNLLSGVFETMYNTAPWLTVGVLSAAMPFIVMTGMHYALMPLFMNNMATLGYDVIVLVTMFCSNIAQGGASLGVALRTKNEETRSEGIACGVSALVADVTEPAMYGINLRYIKPMIAAVIGAGVSGLFCGLTSVRSYSMGGSPSFLSLITMIGGEGNPMHSVIFGAIGGVMSVGIAAVLAFILYKDPETAPAAASGGSGAAPVATATAVATKTVIDAPIPGKVVALETVPDETFATGILGVGFAVEPSEGKVYAPFDGTCEGLIDSLHAMNLKSDSGVELLIHVGLETVGLEGKPFKVKVKEGQRIKKGQLLMEFDPKMIEEMGCKTVSPVLVTNADELPGVKVEDGKIIIGNQEILV